MDNNQDNDTEDNAWEGSGTVRVHDKQIDVLLFPVEVLPEEVVVDDFSLNHHHVDDGCYHRCLRCFPLCMDEMKTLIQNSKFIFLGLVNKLRDEKE